jgi:hypothetical protein
MNAEPARLLSVQGQELLTRLAGMEVTPDRALALSAALRDEFPPDLVAAGLTQQALRVAGRAKFSRADEMLFTRPGLEQASSEITSRHAAERFAQAVVIADLCCGIGGNLTALAAPAPDESRAERRLIGVDRDPLSLEFARHNVAVYAPGAQVRYVRADARELGLAGIDAVFIDPARRDERGRRPAGHYQPELGWCLGLAKRVPAVGIKAAPGLRRNLVPPGWETEFVAVGRELKEALLWSPALAGVGRRATVLPSGDTLASPKTLARSQELTRPGQLTAPDASGGPDLADTPSLTAAGQEDRDADQREPVPLAEPGEFLFDPNPAVTRAGLVTSLARQLGAWQIDPMIAFLSADKPAMTPFARTLRVIESAPWHEKRFAARLRELGIGSADIRRRGLAGDVEQIHRRLGLRGPGAATIVLTRVSDRPWGLICVPVTDPDPA